jgi:C4-dicarboxylate-specific signal transduction histidine kinase
MGELEHMHVSNSWEERALAAEASEARMRAELLAEVAAMSQLHELATRMLQSSELLPLIQDVLEASMELMSAEFGIIQLFDDVLCGLKVFAQRGFERDFLEYFDCVTEGTGSCGMAIAARSRVVVEDVWEHPIFKPHLEVMRRAGVRAVQSTPLISRGGELLGVLSTHFRRPHRPSERDLRRLDLYARQACELIERRRAEEKLQRLQTDLAHVARVTTMGEMASSIAHELNQPLAAIITNAGACARWLAMKPIELHEANAAVASIVRDAERASDVIKRVRNFVQRRGLQLDPLDLAAVACEALAMAEADIRRHDISLSIVAPSGLPAVHGDRVQVQQVIINLLKNAIEAMESVTDRKRTLRVTLRAEACDAVCVAVCDAGVGLEKGQRDRVFDAFHTTKPGGMGMGLAISRSIIEAHGGRLWAAPNEGHGETFSFTLPIAASGA